MGLDERIPLDATPFSVLEPRDKAVTGFANQPSMGCRYRDESSNYTSCASNAATALDFRSGGVEYDPYNMIDLTNNLVRLPTPGVWDVGIEIVTGAIATAGNNVYAQFSRDNTGVDFEGQMVDFRQTSADGEFVRLLISTQFYVTRELLGDGNAFYVTAYNASLSANDIKIVTCSLWLRSANVPSKY